MVFRYENNSRIHTIGTFGVILTGWFLGVTTQEWLWLILAISLVWITEILNTSIEKLVDMVSPDKHPVAGKVKDMAAGAVLIAAVSSAIIGVAVFLPYIINFYNK